MKPTPTHVTVSAAWMNACGYPAVDTEMRVIRFLGIMPNGRDRMFEVERPDGFGNYNTWTVSDWRITDERIVSNA